MVDTSAFEPKEKSRSYVIRSGFRTWCECEDCDFVGLGIPASMHTSFFPGHRLYAVNLVNKVVERANPKRDRDK